MQSTVQQTLTKEQQRARRRYTWVHSTYITAAWNWFLEFIGRSAEAILVVSVLYASVKLLPVVHMPAGLDVVVFIAQFVALDVGGYSLNKLAKQARAEHNDQGAKLAGGMSIALITVMIAGVVVVAIEQLFPIPGNWKLGIDTVLLIARSILAVLYGHTIHQLKGDDQAEQSSAPAAPQIDIQQQIAAAIAEASAKFERRLVEIAEQVKQIPAPAPAPTIDYETISETILTSLEDRFTREMRSFQAEMKQAVIVSQTGEHPAIETTKKPSHETMKLNNGTAKRTVSKQASETPSNVVMLVPNESSSDLVIRLWNEDRSRSYQDVATLADLPKATVFRYLKPYRETVESVSSEPLAARNGTI